MKLGCMLMLLIFLSSVSFGALTKPIDLLFKTCLRQSLQKSSPPDRDNARFVCFEKFPHTPFSTCLDEAKKMEYMSNAEEAMKNCYYSRPQVWSARNCLDVAKKLHTALERDDMRLDCFSEFQAQGTQSTCSMIANSFEQTYYKERFKQVCQDN
jgi:hypothetical protein